MKKAIIILLLIILSFLPLFAQDSSIMLDTYIRNFEKSEKIETKIVILQDAAKTGKAELGPLYKKALDYVLINSSMIVKQPKFRELAFIALEQIQKIGFAEARNSLWALFDIDTNTSIRVTILDSLGILAKGDVVLIGKIITWLEGQNSIYKTGVKPDIQVIASTVKALGNLKDSRAFPILFDAMRLGYSEVITALAKQACFSLDGDLKEMLMAVIKSHPMDEKIDAFKMGMETDRLEDAGKAELAEYTLEIAIYSASSSAEDKRIGRELRYESVLALSSRNWSKATPLIIEHFGITLLEFDRGITTKSRLLEAISALGNMSTHKAAERLTLYLELINSYTEHGKIYDEQVVLAVLYNLKKLGDKIAFADLSNTKYLNYSEAVKKAAQEAVDSLKW